MKEKRLWDPLRHRWVAATPEELVRQRLLQQMTLELGYPKGLLAVEKEIASLLPNTPYDPKRRLDLLCLAPAKEGLVPLLLAECKAKPLDAAAERQAWGYNELLKAPFLCLASPTEVKTLWREKGSFASIPFLPPFRELLEKRCM